MSDFVIENGVLTKYTGNGGDVIIPDGVTSIDKMVFFLCDTLETITISKNVKNIGASMAIGCPKLCTINISEQNEYYTSIDGVIYDKQIKRLIFCPPTKKSITIPESVTVIESGAFRSCEKITTIDISKHITEIGKIAFWGCKSLSVFNVSEENENYTTLDGILYDKQIKTLVRCPTTKKKIIIPESVIKLEQGALESCRRLECVIIQNSEIMIPNDAIRSCDSLRLLQIGDYQITGKIDSILPRQIKEMIEMLKTEKFSIDTLENVKNSTIANHYHRTKSKKALDFIKKNLLTFVSNIFEFNDVEMLQFLTETDEVFTDVIILDHYISLAIEEEKHEIYVILLNYKKEHFGYTDIEKRFKL